MESQARGEGLAAHAKGSAKPHRPRCASLPPMLRGSRAGAGLLVLLLPACGGTHAAPGPTPVVAAPSTDAPSRPRPAGPTRFVLANGMRVIVEAHHARDMVAVQLWVRAGARDEAPG